ncbi:MAG: hypothetical protein KGJ68_15600, partial [Gammaproteobacteria bacterium]|nr:hypothetical protein [Gammaproteobacteria bacterium]
MPAKKLLLLLVMIAAPLGLACAQQPPGKAADPREELAKKIPGGARVDELRATPVPGIFEFTRDGDIAYV